MKYISQLRCGTREQWEAYEATENHLNPLAGELVIEFDTVDGKTIPRLKIGTGTTKCTELDYISLDSFILPKPASVTLNANAWIQDSEDRCHQVVTVNNAVITPHSKVDLQPSPEQLCALHDADVTFTAVNEDGIITVYAVGIKPMSTYVLQCTVTEVILDE